jgi:hypothetical protein
MIYFWAIYRVNIAFKHLQLWIYICIEIKKMKAKTITEKTIYTQEILINLDMILSNYKNHLN